MKVKIGIMARPMISESNKNIYGTYQTVSNTILKFGGIPVGLPPEERCV